MMLHAFNPSTWRPKQKYLKSEIILGFIMRSCLKNAVIQLSYSNFKIAPFVSKKGIKKIIMGWRDDPVV